VLRIKFGIGGPVSPALADWPNGGSLAVELERAMNEVAAGAALGQNRSRQRKVDTRAGGHQNGIDRREQLNGVKRLLKNKSGNAILVQFGFGQSGSSPSGGPQ